MDNRANVRTELRTAANDRQVNSGIESKLSYFLWMHQDQWWDKAILAGINGLSRAGRSSTMATIDHTIRETADIVSGFDPIVTISKGYMEWKTGINPITGDSVSRLQAGFDIGAGMIGGGTIGGNAVLFAFESKIYRDIGIITNTEDFCSIAKHSVQSRTVRMLEKNSGYNVSSESWFNKFNSIGGNGTYLTDYPAIGEVLGPVRANTQFEVGFFSRGNKIG